MPNISINQQQWIPGVSTASSYVVTLTSAVTVGQVVIVVAAGQSGNLAIGASGLTGTSWFSMVDRQYSGSWTSSKIGYGATAGTTITVSFTGNSGTADIWVAVLDNVDPNLPAWPNNSQAQNSVQTSNTNTLAVSTNQFVVGVIALNASTTPTGTTDSGTGWTAVNSTPSGTFLSYVTAATAATYQHQITTSGFYNQSGQIFALNPTANAFTAPAATSNDAYDTAVLADSPTGYWKLDEAAGAHFARDYTANGRHATISGNVGLASAGPNTVLTSVMNFTGVAGDAGHLQLNPSSTATQGNGLTVEFWAKHTNVTWERFFDFGNGASSDNLLASPYDNNGRVAASSYQGGGGSNYEYTGTQPASTYWHHYAIVFDPFWASTQGYNSAYGSIFIYIDGYLYTAQVVSSSYTWRAMSRYYNYIGRSNWSTDPYFNGQMARLAVYQSVLSGTRIAAHYAAATPNTLPEAGHVRLTRQYIEQVVKVIPHMRLTRQFIENVRLLEVHAVKVGAVIAIKPVLYTSNATTPALRHRTTTATAIVELASVPAISPAASRGTITRQRTANALAQAFNPGATPINTSATTTRHRTMSSPTMSRGLLGDNLADAIDPSPGMSVSMPFNLGAGSFTVESGEPGRNWTGGTGWLRWTATYTGNATIVIDNYASVYPYIYMYESSAARATNFGQLTLLGTYGYYSYNGAQDLFPVTQGHTYYWQVAPYGTGYSGTVVLHMQPPPVSLYTTATVSRTRTANNSLVNAGPFTNYVNVGSPVPYNPTLTMRYRSVLDAVLALDSGIGTGTIGGTETVQTRTATGVVTVDVPIAAIPTDVPAVVVAPAAPTVTITNQGTGSLIGGDWEFYVAYFVSAPVEGRFTQAGPIAGATLPVFDPPAGPVFPPPPGGYDQGVAPTLVNDWGDTINTAYSFSFLGGTDSYLVTYDTTNAYDLTYSPLASDGPGVYWYLNTAVDATVAFTPIQPANGSCIWEVYVQDPDTFDWALSLSFDSADPNLSPATLFLAASYSCLITSRFYDENAQYDATGSASFKLLITDGGTPA